MYIDINVDIKLCIIIENMYVTRSIFFDPLNVAFCVGTHPYRFTKYRYTISSVFLSSWCTLFINAERVRLARPGTTGARPSKANYVL